MSKIPSSLTSAPTDWFRWTSQALCMFLTLLISRLNEESSSRSLYWSNWRCCRRKRRSISTLRYEGGRERERETTALPSSTLGFKEQRGPHLSLNRGDLRGWIHSLNNSCRRSALYEFVSLKVVQGIKGWLVQLLFKWQSVTSIIQMRMWFYKRHKGLVLYLFNSDLDIISAEFRWRCIITYSISIMCLSCTPQLIRSFKHSLNQELQIGFTQPFLFLSCKCFRCACEVSAVLPLDTQSFLCRVKS